MDTLVWEKTPSKLRISRSELQVWKVNLNKINKEPSERSNVFSREELNRLRAFKFEKDIFRYEVTHSMKRLILAKYLACNPKDLSFTVGKYGKPAVSKLSNWLNLQFNISHSHKLIIMAVTVQDAVGIDVEYHAESISIENLAAVIFSGEERKFFLSLKTQQEKMEAFFRCWTRKEAYLKARGLGLITDLANISIDMNKLPTSNWLKISTLEENESIKWKLFSLNVGRFYSSAVVATSCQKDLLHFDVTYFLI